MKKINTGILPLVPCVPFSAREQPGHGPHSGTQSARRGRSADVQGGAHMTALSNSFMLEGDNSD
jgi:hypothetical protein